MTVVFGTLGFTPEKLVPTVTKHPSVTKLVFFHDKDPRGKAAAKRVKDFCKERGLSVESHEVNAFDILECAGQMRQALRPYPREEVIFNLTGGTPVISSAATLVCILEGVRAVYIHEVTKEEVSLPLLMVRYDTILNDAQRRVLRHVAKSKDRECTQAEIVKALKLSPSTVSYHVKNLCAQQLLHAEPDEEDTRSLRIRILPSATLLLEDAA